MKIENQHQPLLQGNANQSSSPAQKKQNEGFFTKIASALGIDQNVSMYLRIIRLLPNFLLSKEAVKVKEIAEIQLKPLEKNDFQKIEARFEEIKRDFLKIHELQVARGTIYTFGDSAKNVFDQQKEKLQGALQETLTSLLDNMITLQKKPGSRDLQAELNSKPLPMRKDEFAVLKKWCEEYLSKEGSQDVFRKLNFLEAYYSVETALKEDIEKALKPLNAASDIVGQINITKKYQNKVFYFRELLEQASNISSEKDLESFFERMGDIEKNLRLSANTPQVQLNFLEKLAEGVPLAFTKVSDTYDGTADVRCDYAYANANHQFGYVADGTGHNNPLMSRVLGKIFGAFNKNYEENLKTNSPKSREGWLSFVKTELKALAKTIHEEKDPVEENANRPDSSHTMSEGYLKPAFSFVQVVAGEDNKRFLISAQFADTFLIVKKADGSYDTTLAEKRDNSTQGFYDTPFHRDIITGNIDIPIKGLDVSPGDVVYGFTDGIGEFLTLDECTQIIGESNPFNLLENMKNAIIEKGEAWEKLENKDSQPRIKGANGNSLKFHSPDPRRPGNHDDLGMFVLRVS